MVKDNYYHIAYGIIGLIGSYALVSWAIDSGSLIGYGAGVIFLVVGVKYIIHGVRFNLDGKKRR